MKDDPLKAPLTTEEKRFAEENHHLVGRYLKIRGLSFDEWYDVVIFRYLRSVKRWFAFPELHRHSFEIIAFYAMRSAIGNERQKKRIQAVSLYEKIPGTEGMTWADTVTYENLNYTGRGGEGMNIRYNVQLPEKKAFRGGAKSDETIAIEAFLAGKMKNMCFEYETCDEAKRKASAVQSFRRKHNHKDIYDAYRCENCIYIVRMDNGRNEKVPPPGRAKRNHT